MFAYHQQPKRFKKGARIAAIFISLLILWVFFQPLSISSLSSSSRITFGIPERTSNLIHNRLIGDIKNTTLGFEKIFVISLPSRTDRRDAILLSAALSNIEIEFIDAVQGSDVPDKAMIKTWDYPRLWEGEVGCWRSHVNAMHEIVRRNISSALILEDDADWDIRLKDQLTDFALSTHALIQPLLRTDPALYTDTTYPKPTDDSPGKVPDILFEDLPLTVPPKFSPYGDDWDVLWVGHSAMLFPSESSTIIPKGRVVRKNDETVAGKEHLRSLKEPYEFKEIYPEHTRVVHHPQGVWGMIGYGVSQKAARTILSEIGLRDVYKPIDWLLSYYCEGTEGHAPHNCLTTQPPLFINHRAVGLGSSSSDIRDDNIKYRLEGETDMIRWSVRMNHDNLLQGRDLRDLHPDPIKNELSAESLVVNIKS